jgi:hypothetical protein
MKFGDSDNVNTINEVINLELNSAMNTYIPKKIKIKLNNGGTMVTTEVWKYIAISNYIIIIDQYRIN